MAACGMTAGCWGLLTHVDWTASGVEVLEWEWGDLGKLLAGCLAVDARGCSVALVPSGLSFSFGTFSLG